MNAMNAAAAADFKSGFVGSQLNGLMQPFDADLYSSYSTSYNWTGKVPSPLGGKTFPWPVNVNALGEFQLRNLLLY